MKTFEALYCERNRCTPARFRSEVFWHTVPREVRFLARVITALGIGLFYFARDRKLIHTAGSATSVLQVRDAIDDFLLDPANGRGLRRAWRLRVSTTLLTELAGQYLPRTTGIPTDSAVGP